MNVVQKVTGMKVDGKDVNIITLTNAQGTEVQVSNYGAILKNFIVKDRTGAATDIVLGFDTMEEYRSEFYLNNYPYLGAIIGRYANRIGKGQFTIDDHTYQLAQNSGSATLHGGIEGWDKKVWKVHELRDLPNAKVTFKYVSEDGEEGFPGNVTAFVTYELKDNNELVLRMRATTDKKTPINLTHHDYFNLNGGKGTVENYELLIPASYWLEQDEEFVVTGNKIPVENSAFDFTQAKKIGADWNPDTGYDQSFVLDKHYGDLTLAADAFSPESGIRLQVLTTDPVAHLYTAKYVAQMKGKKGNEYGPFSAFCIETQHAPNAINLPDFKGNKPLKKGEIYEQTIVYAVSAEK